MNKQLVSDAKHIVVLGLGETGLAAVRWCLMQKVAIKIADTREQPPGMEQLREYGIKENTFFLGKENIVKESLLENVDTIVLSPGLIPSVSPIKEILAEAVRQQIAIISEVELFASALADLKISSGYDPKVLAITGTNGKTTVTTMVRDMCEYAGLHAIAAGNISPASLMALMQAIEKNDLPDVWVMELSSFQLYSTFSLHPHAAVVLNITQDHLDWHGSLENYAKAKGRLLELSDIKIVNRDDALTMALVDPIENVHVRTFGSDMPILANDMGIEQMNGMAWLYANEEASFELPAVKKRNPEIPLRKKGIGKRLMPADAMRVRGTHNALNALAAMQLCKAIGITYTPLLTALRNYEAHPHRSCYVRTIQGVDFVDDSKGTNVGATYAALTGIGRPVVIILGGVGKGQDFSPLIVPIQQYARAVLLIGQDKGLIHDILVSTQKPLVSVKTLEEAVQTSMQYAQEGDVVLLSPACASLDMFKNYHHRGQAFVQAVDQLASDYGELG